MTKAERSQARREAVAAGRIVESSESIRRRRRQEASIAREETAIQLYAEGKTVQQISDALHELYGVRLPRDIPALVRRGLYRRVKENEANVEIAKAMMSATYRRLLEVYLPRALGQGEADADGQRAAPDVRAAELALKVLDKWGEVEGAKSPPKAGDINMAVVINGAPVDADAQRARILDGLAVERSKQLEIDDTLAGTPASLEGEIVDDGKVMPPVPLAPQERG